MRRTYFKPSSQFIFISTSTHIYLILNSFHLIPISYQLRLITTSSLTSTSSSFHLQLILKSSTIISQWAHLHLHSTPFPPHLHLIFLSTPTPRLLRHKFIFISNHISSLIHTPLQPIFASSPSSLTLIYNSFKIHHYHQYKTTNKPRTTQHNHNQRTTNDNPQTTNTTQTKKHKNTNNNDNSSPTNNIQKPPIYTSPSHLQNSPSTRHQIHPK